MLSGVDVVCPNESIRHSPTLPVVSGKSVKTMRTFRSEKGLLALCVVFYATDVKVRYLSWTEDFAAESVALQPITRCVLFVDTTAARSNCRAHGSRSFRRWHCIYTIRFNFLMAFFADRKY